MNILLINPCLRPHSPVKILPVGLACIATALDRAGFKPEILDIDLHRPTTEELHKNLSSSSYDMVGFGNIVSSYPVTKALAALIREHQPHAQLVVGNTVATSIPELLLSCIPAVDIAVVGEGDTTVVELANAIAKQLPMEEVNGIVFRSGDECIHTPARNCIPSMSDIPFPDYTLFDLEKYLEASNRFVPDVPGLDRGQARAVPINTARGCMHACTFCAHAFSAYPYRCSSFDTVIEHFTALQREHSINYLAFWDELTLASRARTRELCEALEKHHVSCNWPISPRANTFRSADLDLLKRCRELGAVSIGGALESASPEILLAMNKTKDPESYIEGFVEQALTARKAGLTPQTSLVFGYPQETRETIRLTLETCRRAGVYPSAGFLLPLPDSIIYRQARERGLIPNEEEYLLSLGDRQDIHINLTSLSDMELTDTLTEGLIQLKNDLGVPISDEDVIKTGKYRSSSHNEPSP